MAFPTDPQKKNDPKFLKPYDPNGFKHVHKQRTKESAFLFRIEPIEGGNPVTLVQSAIKPDWDYAFHNAGYLLACRPDVRELDLSFEYKQRLRFRLLANPVRRISDKSVDAKGEAFDKNWIGRRVPVPADKLDQWLFRRAESAGFKVEQTIEIRGAYVYFNKNGKQKKGEKKEEKGRLRSALYKGILEVTDADCFRNTLISGVGPAKSFGFGLLSVAPA